MDVPILRYLDIVIGLSVVMLLICTIVASITQLLLSTTYARARYLRDALGDMVEQIDPPLLGPHARYIAERLLRHPLAARDNTFFGHWMAALRNRLRGKLPLPSLNPAGVVQREEIIFYLLDWATEDGALARQDGLLAGGDAHVKAQLDRLRDILRRVMMRAGVADPAAVAKAVRERILLHESSDPAAPAQVWRVKAISEAALTDLSAKVFTWFDNTMARVSNTFALEAKVVASIIALVVCLVGQVDSVNLLRRLATDDKYRAAVVALAPAVQKQYEEAQRRLDELKSAAKPDDAQAAKQKAAADQAKILSDSVRSAVTSLSDPNLSLLPSYLSPGQDKDRWKDFESAVFWKKLPGILFSWILVSLGAPFWYDLLKKLLGLRSLLARKDDDEARQRQQQQQPPRGTPPPAPPPAPAAAG
jgi:hypothetical protein